MQEDKDSRSTEDVIDKKHTLERTTAQKANKQQKTQQQIRQNNKNKKA